jgi:hypothetical protein
LLNRVPINNNLSLTDPSVTACATNLYRTSVCLLRHAELHGLSAIRIAALLSSQIKEDVLQHTFPADCPVVYKIDKLPRSSRVIASIANEASTAPMITLADPCSSSRGEEIYLTAKSRVPARSNRTDVIQYSIPPIKLLTSVIMDSVGSSAKSSTVSTKPGLVAFARCRRRHAFDGGIFRVVITF